MNGGMILWLAICGCVGLAVFLAIDGTSGRPGREDKLDRRAYFNCLMDAYAGIGRYRIRLYNSLRLACIEHDDPLMADWFLHLELETMRIDITTDPEFVEAKRRVAAIWYPNGGAPT